MTSLTQSPVSARERTVALDVVRGLAVLGILVMNIVEFGLPIRAYNSPEVAGGTTGSDLWTWLVQSSLFDGRMRALFSMLFGAGIVLIGERMAEKGRGDAAADLLLRRCLWLIPFGIAHRFLLQWTGDILYMYGLFGVLAVAFRNLRPRTQVLLGLLALSAFVPIELRRHHGADELRTQSVEADRLAAAGAEIPAGLATARERWQRRIAPAKAGANDAEIAAMRGTWLDVASYRYDYNHTFQHAYVYHHFTWDVFGMILLGMGLSGLGFFAGRLRTRTYVAAVAAGAAAAAVSFWFADAWADTGWSAADIDMQCWRGMLYPWLRGLSAIAWAAVLILCLRLPSTALLTTPLAAVGRMAFSNYILQTLCCTFFFFGWGLGYYGKLSRSELMFVVAGVSLIQIGFSLLWLRAFRFGPLEWAWRSLTYWQRQPMRAESRETRDARTTPGQ